MSGSVLRSSGKKGATLRDPPNPKPVKFFPSSAAWGLREPWGWEGIVPKTAAAVSRKCSCSIVPDGKWGSAAGLHCTMGNKSRNLLLLQGRVPLAWEAGWWCASVRTRRGGGSLVAPSTHPGRGGGEERKGRCYSGNVPLPPGSRKSSLSSSFSQTHRPSNRPA